MTPIKMFWVQFRAEDADGFDKVRFANGITLQLVTGYQPAEYSVEVGVLVGVPRDEKFFKNGDTVLLHYDVFTRGKYPHLAKEEARAFAKQEREGFAPDIHFATRNEILGKVEGDNLIAPPNRTLARPIIKDTVTSTLIHLPQSGSDARKDAVVKKSYWAEVVGASDQDEYELGLKPGDIIFCREGAFVPMYYKTNNPYHLLCIYNDSIMAKKDNR